MIVNCRYTGINLSGWIQGVAMNEKSILCVFWFKKKEKVKTAHWVGHSQLRSLDTDNFFKITPGVEVKQVSVTVDKMKQSVSGVKKNQFLLQ